MGWTTQLLLLVDRRQARIFKVRLQNGVPQQVIPYDPYGFRRGRHLLWNSTAGEPQSITANFRDAIATTLRGSEHVLVLANGPRAASVAAQLRQWFQERHPGLNARLIGSMLIDEPEPGADRLLAKVQEFTAVFDARPND